MKTTNKFLLTLTFFTVLVFILSSCSEPYDPAVIPETEVFSPIDIEDTVVTETYFMFRLRFIDAYDISNPYFYRGKEGSEYNINTYRTYRVTEKELANHNKLYAIFAPIEADEIKQTWAYEQIDEPTEIFDGRVYYLETEQVEQMARELFGKDVKLIHKSPHRSPSGSNFPFFNNGRYEWRDPNGGGDFRRCVFHVPTSAEKSENYLIIYDKYINVTISDDDIRFFYGDSEFTTEIEIPDEYKPSDIYEGPLYEEKENEVVLKYGTPYKHTFKLAEDGTYFWVSSEPITD